MSYLLVIFGMLFVWFLLLYMNIPHEFSFLVKIVIVVILIVDLIFLLKFLTIEYSRERFMSPMIRKNKAWNFFWQVWARQLGRYVIF